MEKDIRCSQCKKFLYRTDGANIKCRGAEHERIDSIEPIVLTVANKWRVILCSKFCAVQAISAAEDKDLRGGFPLW